MTLEVRSLRFGYGKGPDVLKGVTVHVESGEIYSILGASGSGKTTLIKVIAGFVTPRKGRIFLDGKDITDVKVEKRSIGIVFQDYALFPHMTVRKNIEFPLRIRRLPEGQLSDRRRDIIELVGLSGLEDRFPSELSGGERQRVAIARMLASDPKVLLLDEPLSALDASLREDLRRELRSILGSSGIPTLYITHDQREALAISHRIGYLQGGRIEEEGSPQDLYWKPISRTTAKFMGLVNIFKVRKRLTKGLMIDPGHIPWKERAPAFLGFRPESVRLQGKGLPLAGTITSIEIRGKDQVLGIETPHGPVRVELDSGVVLSEGEEFGFVVPFGSLIPLEGS